MPSLNFISSFEVPFLKIASASITNIPLLKAHNKMNIPTILSTGMSTENQIKTAITCFNKKNVLGILHCNSSYPCPYEDLNLRYINKLKKKYPTHIIGYSGHESGLSPTLAAVVLGAQIIERHITLDKSLWGTDQQSSIEPLGYARLIRDIRIVERSLGHEKKLISKLEKEVMKKLRQ